MSRFSAGRGHHHLQRTPQQAQRQVHLQEIIDQCIKEEYKREKYVSTFNVFNRIKSTLGSSRPIDNDTILNGIESLSELNKQISLLVDVYYSTTPIKTVSDCEEYVTTELRNWMVYYKNEPGAYESFEVFGVGSFRYNPHVMEKFKYRKVHAEDLPNVSVIDVIQSFLDIVSVSNRSTNHRIGSLTSSIVNLPEGMEGGQIIGRGGSISKLLKEITGATSIHVCRTSRTVTIHGTQEAIENCTQMIDRIHRHGVSATTNCLYQDQFETRLRFDLERKYNITSIEKLGVVVKARDIHYMLSGQLQSVKEVYDNAANMFKLELKKRLKVQWGVWLSRKAVKGNVLEWLSEETRSDAEDVYSQVSEYFDANDCPSFAVMLAAMLRAILAQAKSLSAGNPAIHNYKQNLSVTAASVGSKDVVEEEEEEEGESENEAEDDDEEEEEDDDDDDLFAVVISRENFRDFSLEFARIFPSLISLLTYGFDRPSILHSSDDVVNIGNVSSSNMELMAIDAFKKAVLSLAIPEDIVSSMQKLLEDFRSEISVKFEANRDINCDVNSQFNAGNSIKIFNTIFWQLVVKVNSKMTSVSVHSYCGDDKYEYDEEIQALSCFLLSPADQTLDVFSTDNNKEFQDHLLDLADGSSVILIFQNVSTDELMTLDPRTVEICREKCGAVSVPTEIGAKSSHLCFAVKGVLSREGIDCTEDISSAKQLHLYIMNKELFQGLAGLHALYYSMVNYLLTIYSYSSPEDLLNTTGKLNETIFSQIEDVPVDNLSDSIDVPAMFSKVFCAISSVESAVLKKLKIPSFDSLNSGSFISYLTKDSGIAFVRALLNRLFGDDEKLMISLGGNSVDTAAMERKSPRDRTRSTESYYRADPNVDIEYISRELCKIVGELDINDMQLQGPSSLLNLFMKLQLMERGLLDIYNESGRRSTGFVDSTSLTFIQFIVSQLEMFQPDMLKQFTAICFPVTSETVIQDVRQADVVVDDLQASLLVDCVNWFDRNDKQANQECDTSGLSGAFSGAVALLTRVTLKETSSLVDRADAYSSFIHKSEEAHSFRGYHPDGLLVYCPCQSVSGVDQHHVAPGDFDDSEFIGKVIAKLKAVPFGVRCSVGVNWKLLIRHLDSSKPLPEIPLLLKAHENVLTSANRKFMIISCDDAIPIPDALATTAEIATAVKSYDLYLLASWFLLAAVLDDHARMQFINNCVAALRQAFISQTPEESSVSDNGWVLKLGIDIAGILPDYMGSLVFTPWIKHIVTTYSSGIQVTTAEDNFCEYIMGLPLNERIVTAARISALLACSPPGDDSTFNRIEDFFLSTDLTSISKSPSVSTDSGHVAIRTANSANGNEKNESLDRVQDSKSASQFIVGEGDSKLSSLGSTEGDFDETNPQLCKELITEIFNSADVKSSFTGSLQKALSLLSQMNSRDVHFVLEVIQNAADSTYPTTAAPTLLIQLYREKIVVKTNEIGFSRANVKAITAVGMSHKKNIAGYIGHKGIGFKTVFAVTDKPEIHSKGFHFYFDKTQGSLMAPYWIEDTGTSWSYSNNPHYRTSIVLPLKKEALANFPKLKENLYLAFDKNLLLFLGKLSVMILEDFTVAEGKLTTFRRVPLTDHWLLCEHEEVSTDFWYIKRKRFFPSVPKSTDDVEGDIAETEIAVAFNFREDSSLEAADSGVDNLAAESSKKEEDDVDITVERSSLRLTVSKDSMPIYSFLPTKTAAFKFIVQADFVLATNRESLVDQHPYNQQLIFQLINLITEIFQEFALYLQFQIDLGSGSSSDNKVNPPALSQLCEICDRHKLGLTPEAVVALLPRPYSCTIHKEIQKNLSEKICYNLRNCRIFLSTGRVLCDAAALLVAPIFPDVVTDFLPESVLFKLIGKRFPHPSLVLDDDLKFHFNIKQLRAAHIVDCLEEAVSEAGPYLEAAERVNVVSRLLVVLAILTTEELPNSVNRSNATTGATKRPNNVRNLGPIPSAVTKMHHLQQQQGQSTGTSVPKTRQLPLDLLSRLKKLPLWLLTSGVFVSSEASSLFLQSSNDLPKIVSQCMAQYLTHLIHVVDEAFFNSADTASHNLGGFLKEFVAVNFKPTLGHFGLHSLTSTMLLSNILVPALIDKNNSPTVDQACALLACTYICSDKARSMDNFLRAAGVWIPAVNVRESKDKGNKTWKADSDHVVYVSTVRDATEETTAAATNIDGEVHLGPEFPTSATSRLFSTLMKQIGWKFIHPKVYCLIYEVEFREDKKDNLFTDIQVKLSSDSGVANLKTFLKKAGVINFFKGYKGNGSGSVCTAPSLAAFLSKLLANSESVCLRNSQSYNQAALFLFQSENAQRSQQSSVSPRRRNQSDEQLITYTENEDIYDLIKAHLLDLIHEELREVILPCEKRVVEQVVTELLNRYPCIPVTVRHPSIPEKKLLLASIDAAVIRDTQSFCWSHFAYVYDKDHKDVIPQNLRTLFDTIGVRTISNFQKIAFPELVNIFSWMSRQPQVVASVEMMSDIYFRIQAVLSDAQQLVEFKAEIGVLRDLFSSDAPVLWFPSSYSMRDGNSRDGDSKMTSGKMYRPSDVVLYGIFDVTNKFPLLLFPGCPVRVLSYHYDEKIVGIFKREVYCNYCKLVEGFYCFQGLPIGDTIRCGSTDPLRCCCRGSKMEPLSHSKRGLIKSSLTLKDWVLVTNALQRKLDPQGNFRTKKDFKDSETVEKSLVAESLEDEMFLQQFTAEMYQYILIASFESINRALFKCFTQVDGLFPYTPKDVQSLKDMWCSEEFLWSFKWKDSSPCWLSFKDTSSMVTLVVENSEMFLPFSNKLGEYSSNIRVLDLTFSSSKEGGLLYPNIQFTSLTSPAPSLDMFEARYTHFLKQDKNEIDHKCNMKPFQPLQCFPLLCTDLLPNTIRLSEILSTRLHHHRDVVSKGIMAASFMQQHIVRLYITLAFLQRDYNFAFDALMGDGRFYTFLSSKIIEVDELCWQSTLDLGKALSLISITNKVSLLPSDLHIQYHVDSKSDASCLKVYLHTSLKKVDLKENVKTFTIDYLLEPLVRHRLAQYPGAFESLTKLLGDLDNVLLEHLWDHLEEVHGYPPLSEETIAAIQSRSHSVPVSKSADVDNDSAADADDDDDDDVKFDGAETNLAAFLRLDKSLRNSKREAKKAFLSSAPLADEGGLSPLTLLPSFPTSNNNTIGSITFRAPLATLTQSNDRGSSGGGIDDADNNIGEEHSSMTRTPNTGNSSPRVESSSAVNNNGTVIPPSDEISTTPPPVSNYSTSMGDHHKLPSPPPTTTTTTAAEYNTEVNIRAGAAGTTAGNNTGYLHRGFEHYPFPNKPPARGVEILDINIEDDALLISSIMEEHAALFNNTNEAEEGSSSRLDASTAANLKHGKVGECIAEKLLKSRFPNSTIQWMNRDMESTQPYDFLVTDSTTSSRISRFVEVKTRVSPEPVSQWFISRNELMFASEKHMEANYYYSCLFIHLVEVENNNNRGAASSEALTLRSTFWVDDLMTAASGDDTGLQFSVQVVHNNTAR